MNVNFYKALSLLLDYPSGELVEHLGVLAERIVHSEGWTQEESLVVGKLISHLAATPLTEVQADYVRTFDLSAEHSLHLTHHLFGDDKNRGPALIDLTEMYKEYGLAVASNELPDFLPLVLEFASGLDDAEARTFLGDAAKVTAVLAGNLETAGSVYAPVLRLIEKRGGLLKLAA
ncbi:MAG: nitrate reductase molybdenum cofactor assembly chaperone [Betaproteobacteria bacterium]|nr:nitrate reductase molybdenum cofactor assembly chaperone [Betaproteobacteria bacterium]